MIIRIDFEGKSMIFRKPIKVLLSHEHATIQQHLDEIEALTQQGYYAVGYLSYESSSGFNTFNQTKQTSNKSLPLLLFGIFDSFSVPDEQDDIETVDFSHQHFALRSNTDIDEYNQKIAYIKSQIEAGNTYQTNYTIQFTAPFDANPIDYYRFLQRNNKANYCAYLHFEQYHILSISPELFFKLEGQTITTKPMKGTAARGVNNEQDKQKLASLFSEKNQAENMMIVDLLRNDLSRISQPGTVSVTKLFEAEKYPTVWQLTSTIQSQLKDKVNLYQIFQALFPCGSITGAPKASTMKIIAEIENSERGIYCGTIGYIEPFLQKALFNIPIRTLTINQQKQQMMYGVGGGITWDSTYKGEYSEVLEKTAILNATKATPDYLIESLLLEDGHFLLLDAHLARLQDSARYFDFECDIQAIQKQLLALAQSHIQGTYKVRLLQRANATCDIECSAINAPMLINELQLAPNCVDSHNVYLYHKTSNRQHFPTLTAGKEFIIFNEKNEITEFVNGNIVLLINHKWVTPKITAGLLSGIMRQFYLHEHKISEQTVQVDDLLKAEKIAFINSVRRWITIDDDVLTALKKQMLREDISNK